MDASLLELPVHMSSGSRRPAALCLSGHAWRSAAGLHDAKDQQQKQGILITASAVFVRRSWGPRRGRHDRAYRLFVAAPASVVAVRAAATFAVIVFAAVAFASASMTAAPVRAASIMIAAVVDTVSVVAASIAAASAAAVAAE